MDVFRHYNVGDYIEDIAAANLFEDGKKEISCLWRSQQRPAMQTATCDVMEVAVTVVASESSRHGRAL